MMRICTRWLGFAVLLNLGVIQLSEAWWWGSTSPEGDRSVSTKEIKEVEKKCKSCDASQNMKQRHKMAKEKALREAKEAEKMAEAEAGSKAVNGKTPTGSNDVKEKKTKSTDYSTDHQSRNTSSTVDTSRVAEGVVNGAVVTAYNTSKNPPEVQNGAMGRDSVVTPTDEGKEEERQATRVAQRKNLEEQKAPEVAMRQDNQKAAMKLKEEGRKNGAAAYELTLKGIYTSYGELSPPFSPDHFDYTVSLKFPHESIALLPEIFQDRVEYHGGANHLPLIQTIWDGRAGDAVAEPTAVAVRRQIELPDDGSDQRVTIRVIDPFDNSHAVDYRIVIKQASGGLPVLRSIEALDENGNGVRIDPIPSRDTIAYTAYVAPNTHTVMIKAICGGSWITINGQRAASGVSFTVVRDLKRHIQVVEITCGQGGNVWQSQSSNTYFLKVVSDFPAELIPMPTIVVDDVGEECIKTANAYQCPDPKTEARITRLTAFVEPQISYTIQNPDKSVFIRLLNELPSIPFTYTSDLTIKAAAGQFSREWPIGFSFSGGAIARWLEILGYLIGVLFAVLVASMALILAGGHLFSMGRPIGLTEIASTLTFLLQFLCYANSFAKCRMLSNVTRPISWITLFWPLPNQSVTGGSVTNLVNAKGCLFLATLICLSTFVIHLLVVSRHILFQRNFTLPHNLALGGVESRVFHWLIFPVMVASSMILSMDTSSKWKFAAFLAIGCIVIWLIVSWWLVRNAVARHDAVWVWGSSAHEGDHTGEDIGFWADAVCDQLATQPATRSFLPFFDWKWISTVGDIEPVHISKEKQHNQSVVASTEESASLYSSITASLHTESTLCHCEICHPSAKYPKSIEVIRACSPVPFCPGSRGLVGLFRTDWLETIMTSQAVTVMHDKILRKYPHDGFSMPLIVKTNQLQGPITAGRYSFFFDGARVPFIKFADSLVRILLGFCIGLILSQNSTINSWLFGAIGVGAALCFYYCAVTCPYVRNSETWLYSFALLSISVTSFGLVGHSVSPRVPSSVPDAFLYLTATISAAIAIYSTVVTMSLFAAFTCPPLPEARFIDSIANCLVTIADHTVGWMVQVPGWTRVESVDLKAQCTVRDKRSVNVSIYATRLEPCFELSIQDVRNICRSATLRQPIATVTIPSPCSALGYNYLNIYDRNRLEASISEFLAEEPSTRDTSKNISRQIVRQLNARGNSNAIFTITVAHPKEFFYETSSNSATSRSESGYEWSTNTSSSATTSSKMHSSYQSGQRRTVATSQCSARGHRSIEMSRPTKY